MLLWPIFGDWVGATKMRSCCSMLWICKISKSYELEIWPSLPWTSGNLQKLEKFFDWSIFAVSKFVFKSFFLPCFAVFPCAFAKSAMFSFETKGMKDAVKLKMHEAKKRTLVSKARRDFKVWKSERNQKCMKCVAKGVSFFHVFSVRHIDVFSARSSWKRNLCLGKILDMSYEYNNIYESYDMHKKGRRRKIRGRHIC